MPIRATLRELRASTTTNSKPRLTPQHTTDVRSNFNDQIVYAAEQIGSSEHRAKVFAAICRGKAKVKSRSELEKATQLTNKQVLNAGKALADAHLIHQTKKDGQTAYEKDDTFCRHSKRILNLALDPVARSRVPTKVNPSGEAPFPLLQVNVPAKLVDVRQLTVDDLESFARVRQQNPDQRGVRMPEKNFKAGIQRILGETGTFQDWGGEGNDLFTTRVIVNDSRLSAAFAFKGPGTGGKLTPKKMGKNGDQIQRLFRSPADAFFVQYWADIDEAVIEQMKSFSIAKSALEGRQILFGVIDGTDSARIISAYSECFVSPDS